MYQGTPGLTVTSRQNTFLDGPPPAQPTGFGGAAPGGFAGTGWGQAMPQQQMMGHQGINMGGGSNVSGGFAGVGMPQAGGGGPAGSDPYSFIKANYLHGDEAGSTRKIWEEGQRQGWTNEQMGAGLGFNGQQVQDHFAKYGLGGGQGGTGGGNPQYPNPYLQGMADDITRRSQSFLDQNTRSNAIRGVMAGGYGDSGWGMAQGKAVAGAADNLQGNLAGLFGGAWNQDQNRGLQRYQGDQQFALGVGGLDNQRTGMNQSFYTQQRGQDLQTAGLGADLMSRGTSLPWVPYQNAAQTMGGATGGTGTTSTPGANPWTTGLSTGLGLWAAGNKNNWWGS